MAAGAALFKSPVLWKPRRCRTFKSGPVVGFVVVFVEVRMNLFETVTAHSAAMRLPLYAVTVTSVARHPDAALLSLHWHGFLRQTPLKMPGVELPRRPVPLSIARLDISGERPDTLEQALLEAAWQLGAWDLERIVRPPWWRLGAPATEVSEALRAFGYADEEDAAAGNGGAGEHAVAQASDRDQMLREASRRGYVRWLFRPRKGGIWSAIPEDADDTLDSSGGRTLPCPVVPGLASGPGPQRIVYRLGHANGPVLGSG